MTITALPTPPQPSDSKPDFNTKMFAFLAAMVDFVTQTNATASAVDADEVAANASKLAAAASAIAAQASQIAAAASADAAAASAGGSAWVSGTTYAIGDRRWSLVNQQLYARLTNGAGTTDPASDPTNWAPVWARPELVTAESLFLAAI